MSQAWIVRAGRDDEYEQEVLGQGVVAMGWRRLGDLTRYGDHRAINSLVDDAYAEFSLRSRQEYGAQLYAFRSRMRPGDYIVLLRRNAPDLAVGTVTGDYVFRPELPAPHVRSVRWARIDVSRAEVGADLLAAPALTSIYRITRHGVHRRLAEVIAASQERKRPVVPHVGQPSLQPAASESAMDNLRRNLDYAYSLATAGQSLQDLKVQSFDVTDVYRAAWVQGVAALDHWVRLEIRDRMVAQVRRKPAGAYFQLPPALAEQVAAESLTADAAVYAHWREAVERRVFQRPDVIEKWFQKVANAEALWPRVATVLTERGEVEETYVATDVVSRLKGITQRRHDIVHAYDEDPNRPPAKQVIDKVTTMRAIDWIGQLAEAIVVVLDGKR
jgi:hypothetical protein